MDALPSETSESHQDAEEVATEVPTRPSPPLKFGGVLIFVAIGLVLSFVQNLGQLFNALAPFLQPGVWERLTSPEWTSYHPYWKPVLLLQLSSSSTFVGLNLIALILFFRKARVFPKFIVVIIPAIFILGVIDHYFSGLVPAIAESSEYSAATHSLIVRFVALHIWIPYFLVSKRVKSTFVN